MKRNLMLPAAAVFVLSFASMSLSAQPNYRGRGNRPEPDYRQSPMPAAPVIIVDGDGRWSNNGDRRFDNCNMGQTLSRKQRKNLEKRLGYVPPLVMYVPDRYVNRNGLYVYNNGVVYHKDRDGYFHLDERYYNDRWDDYKDKDSRNNNNRNNNYGWNNNNKNRY